MNTQDFIRKLRRYARKRDIHFEVKKHESKGSHRRVYIGKRRTTVPWTEDLTKGIVHTILKQLGIDDFY